MRTTVKIEGLRELDDALKKLPQSVGKTAVRATLRKQAKPVADGYKARVRRKTGHLARSAGVSTKLSRRQRQQHRKERDPSVVEMFVGAGPNPQSITEEFGTVDQAPQGALRETWDATRQAVLAGIKKDAWREIERAAQRHARKMARLAKG